MGTVAQTAQRIRKPSKALTTFVVFALLCAPFAEAKPARVVGRKPYKGQTPAPQDKPRISIPAIPSLGNVGWDGKTGTGKTDDTTTSSASNTPPNSGATNFSTAIATATGAGTTPSGVKPAASSLGGVGDGAKVGFDESRKNTDALSTVDGGGGGGKKGPGPGASGDLGQISEFPYIWPMCIFSPQGTAANGITDQLIKMSAKCKVQLMVFPMFVKSTKGDGKKVAEAASSKCNADVGLKRFGVNRATALVITDDEKQPAQFCNVSGVPAKDKRGCAQSTFDVGYSVTTRLANTEGLPTQASNKIAAAIVHKSATIQDFAYWTQGWGQVGRPPGPGGNRIGDWSMGYSDARSEKTGWDDDFCKDMQKNSFKNPGIKYDPKHDRWMMEPDDKNKLVDLFDKKPLWSQPAAPPKPGKELKDPSNAGGAADLASSGGPGSSGGGSTAAAGRTSGSAVPQSGGEAVLGVVTGGGGHKISGKSGGGRGNTVRTVNGGYGGAGAGGSTELAGIATAGAGGAGGSTDANVVTVDRKNGGGGAGGRTGDQLAFDETMTAGGATAVVGSGGTGGTSGGSVLSGGSTTLTTAGGGAGAGAGAAGGAAGTGLSAMDSGFFGKLNFIPIEGIRKRIPLLKDSNGVLSARERGNWDGATVKKDAPTSAVTPVSPAASASAAVTSETATRGPASVDESGAVVSRRGKAEAL